MKQQIMLPEFRNKLLTSSVRYKLESWGRNLILSAGFWWLRKKHASVTSISRYYPDPVPGTVFGPCLWGGRWVACVTYLQALTARQRGRQTLKWSYTPLFLAFLATMQLCGSM